MILTLLIFQDNATRNLNRVASTAVNPYRFVDKNDNNNNNVNNNNINNNNKNATKKLNLFQLLKQVEAVNPYHICAICREQAADKESNVGKAETVGTTTTSQTLERQAANKKSNIGLTNSEHAGKADEESCSLLFNFEMLPEAHWTL